MTTEIIYEYETTVAMAGKAIADHNHDGFKVYAMSKMRDEVTLRLRREVKPKTTRRARS
jgi:hypothetical protein